MEKGAPCPASPPALSSWGAREGLCGGPSTLPGTGPCEEDMCKALCSFQGATEFHLLFDVCIKPWADMKMPR